MRETRKTGNEREDVFPRTESTGSGMLVLIFLAVVAPFVTFPFVLISDRSEAREQVESAMRGNVSGEIEKAAISTRGALYTTSTKHHETARLRTGVGYDASILRAIKRMGLVPEHFELWMEEHPRTALKHVKFMPAVMQAKVASTALFIRSSNAKIDPKTAWREAAALVHYSNKHGVPSVLSTAVAHAESTFNPDAVSPKGAQGVMQVMWRIHNGLLVANGIEATPGQNPLADLETAIDAGCLLLSRYIKACGSVQAAMERYYGGRSSSYRSKVNGNITKIMNHRMRTSEL